MDINLSTNYNQNKMTNRENTMKLMKQGVQQQAEELKAKQEANRNQENVTNLSNHDETMTTEQKLDLAIKAIADLTLKVNGGASDAE